MIYALSYHRALYNFALFFEQEIRTVEVLSPGRPFPKIVSCYTHVVVKGRQGSHSRHCRGHCPGQQSALLLGIACSHGTFA